MKTPKDTTAAACESERKQASLTATSKDERWRAFVKHAGLMQFIPSATYYARCKVQGKSIRASLKILDVHLPTTDERTAILSRYTHPETNVQLLLQRLKLEWPAQPPPKIVRPKPLGDRCSVMKT